MVEFEFWLRISFQIMPIYERDVWMTMHQYQFEREGKKVTDNASSAYFHVQP